MKRPSRIVSTRTADDRHRVVSVEGDGLRRRRVCAECPWRRDVPTGTFPAEAFRLSASSAYDMSTRTFGCHMTGIERTATCAGFLLRGAEHSLAIRLDYASGRLEPPLEPVDVPLYDDYVDMAVANGVDPADPVLQPCRRSSFAEDRA